MSEKLLLRKNGDDTSKDEITLQPEFVRQLRVLFDILDSDQDGYIELNELKRYWEIKNSLPDKDINNNIELDEDNDKKLNIVTRRQNTHPFALTLEVLSDASTGHQFITFQQFYYSVKIALTKLQGETGKKPKLRPTSYVFAISNRSFVEECNHLSPSEDIGCAVVKNALDTGFHSNPNVGYDNHLGHGPTVSIEASTKRNSEPIDLEEKIEKLEKEKAKLVKELFEMKSKQPEANSKSPF